MSVPNAPLINLCDCSTNGLKLYQPCVPNPGSNCIQTIKCETTYPYDVSKNPYGCSSLDAVATFRRIQGQSRMPESQYTSGLKAVTVADNSLKYNLQKHLQSINSSRVWGNVYYLRNQSDQIYPSGSLNTAINDPYLNSAITQCTTPPGHGGCPMAARARGRQGGAVGSNSTKSSLVSNRPGGGIGGIGVDVKHGSYARYLAKKTGKILAKPSVVVTHTPPLPIQGSNNQYNYRRGFNNNPVNNKVYKSAGMNNYVYKFGPVVSNCKNCNPPNN